MSIQETQKPDRKSQYVRLFTIISIGLLVVSGIHLWSVVTNSSVTESTADFVYHFISAVGFFVASRMVKNGKRAVIFLLGLIGLASVIYSIAMGRGFNPVTLIIQAIFIWQMVNLSKIGELT